MARPKHHDTPTYGFKSIQFLENQSLGIGSYGSVCKALCDDLLCAAKIIHKTLIVPNADQVIERKQRRKLPISRFMQECEFMSAIRHPNIVQYLGSCEDPQTGLPVLLMELMDDSLTHFLESSQEAVPYHIQINFCHDITMAISYLHSNGIAHRDLSSNNVLLCGTVKAKVTDFGMAKLHEISPNRASLTLCPGTTAYMPPEAVKEKPDYTEKIDCFAIGTLIIQILTRYFPDPGESLKMLRTDDPRFPGGTAYVPIPETERRRNHISQADPDHPLLPIALDCLKNSDVDRPSAQELCQRIAPLKETPQYTESVRRAQERQFDTTSESGELERSLQEKEEMIEALQQECQQLREAIRDKDQRTEERELQLQQSFQQFSQTTTSLLQTQIQQLQQKLKVKSTTETLNSSLSDPAPLDSSPYYINTLDATRNILDPHSNISDLDPTETDISTTETPHFSITTSTVDPPKSPRCDVIIRDPLKTSHSDITTIPNTSISNLDPPMSPQTCTSIMDPPTSPQFSLTTTKSRSHRPTDPPKTSYMYTQSMDPPHMYTDISRPSNEAETIDSGFTLRWRDGKMAPCEMFRPPDAIADDDTVYVKAGDTLNIYAYNSTDKTWNKLPDCEIGKCSLAVVNNLLTTIGGKTSDGNATNKLFSLTSSGKGRKKKWRELFQSMPTKRFLPMTVCSGQALIVTGGRNQDRKKLRTVDVMDVSNKQWTSAADLPEPLSSGSVTICNDRIFIVGASNNSGPTKSVYTCTLIDLYQSCHLRSLREHLAQSLSLTHPPTGSTMIWNRVADLPALGSTCVTLHGRLLAIGGSDSNHLPTSDVRIYHPTSDTWELISKMKASRRWCLAAVLPDDTIMVMGGYSGVGVHSATDSIQLASVAVHVYSRVAESNHNLYSTVS